MDLSPRESESRRRKRNPFAYALLAVALLGIGAVLYFGLKNATSYYCNADEVGVKSGCSGTARFRLQGTVVAGSVKQGEGIVDFVVEFNKKQVRVHHSGDPQQLFKEGIGVVVVGNLAGDRFESDEMMVKHSESYKAKNPDRVPGNAP